MYLLLHPETNHRFINKFRIDHRFGNKLHKYLHLKMPVKSHFENKPENSLVIQ